MIIDKDSFLDQQMAARRRNLMLFCFSYYMFYFNVFDFNNISLFGMTIAKGNTDKLYIIMVTLYLYFFLRFVIGLNKYKSNEMHVYLTGERLKAANECANAKLMSEILGPKPDGTIVDSIKIHEAKVSDSVYQALMGPGYMVDYIYGVSGRNIAGGTFSGNENTHRIMVSSKSIRAKMILAYLRSAFKVDLYLDEVMPFFMGISIPTLPILNALLK